MTALGLTSTEARRRLAEYGPNTFVRPSRVPRPVKWIASAAVDPMVLLLLAAAGVYVWIGERTDAIAALVAVLPIALMDIGLEVRTERALDELHRLSAPRARAFRDGELVAVAVEDLVPLDTIQLREGDVIPADGLVLDGQLHVDESPLTGESEAIAKTGIADSDVFAGSRVLSGRATARIVTTGRATRYGQVAELVARAKQPETPLRRTIRRLFVVLSIVAAVLCLAVVALELARGASASDAIITGVSLAMAAIPEEIPVVATLYLGLGAWRLARSRALVRQLVGVETLGTTTVICVDKTGTLTEGRLRAVSFVPFGGTTERELLEAAVLACEREPFDPLDLAIIEAARSRGIDVAALHGRQLLRDHPFDPVHTYVTHVWADAAGPRAYAKGALETIVLLTRPGEDDRAALVARNDSLAAAGERVIAVASGRAPANGDERLADEAELVPLGLIGSADPPRATARATVEACVRARMRVVMITGDHPATARAVANACGLMAPGDEVVTGRDVEHASDDELGRMVERANVFARVRPEHKLRIVRALRAAGEVVAVTGDGINDAPALREAHIGIAMGTGGTAVAREAATIVLLDNDLSTIVGSVADGRRIFDNLARAISYLVAFHIPLVLGALVIPLVGAPLLLLPLHLVWLEVIVHPTASLVFEADPPEKDVMTRAPRRAGELVPSGAERWLAIARGVVLTAAVLALYLLSLGRGEEVARTMGVTALIWGQAALVLGARAGEVPLWRAPLSRNRVLPFVLLGTLASAILVPYVGPLAEVLRMRPLGIEALAVALAVGLGAALGPELLKRPGRIVGQTPAATRSSAAAPRGAARP